MSARGGLDPSLGPGALGGMEREKTPRPRLCFCVVSTTGVLKEVGKKEDQAFQK